MADQEASGPRLVVFSTLFPNAAQPQAGLFVRERMFRVGRCLPITVVAPVPWFPLQAVIRWWRPHFRPSVAAREVQEGVEVLHPRFLCFPGVLKWLDGLLLAMCAYPLLKTLRRQGRMHVLDAHFGYPDGYAATLLGRWLGVPVTITLRGTEVRHAATPALRGRLARALHGAAKVFSVSESLRSVALDLGVPEERTLVVGNGVDAARFQCLPRAACRRELNIPVEAPVLVSVGALTERKGFHRVIELLPALRARWPNLLYLVVGGSGPEGDWRGRLEADVSRRGLEDAVRFLGPLDPDRLNVPLSAADVFVLATRNEGWANVFLEAMACGLPVVTTDVGGNREVVTNEQLGTIVPFGRASELEAAIDRALRTPWDRAVIRAHAERNDWSQRVEVLCREFERIALHRNPGDGASLTVLAERSRGVRA